MNSVNVRSTLDQSNHLFNLNFADGSVMDFLRELPTFTISFTISISYFSHSKELVEISDHKLG